jgi:hypothetical protein
MIKINFLFKYLSISGTATSPLEKDLAAGWLQNHCSFYFTRETSGWRAPSAWERWRKQLCSCQTSGSFLRFSQKPKNGQVEFLIDCLTLGMNLHAYNFDSRRNHWAWSSYLICSVALFSVLGLIWFPLWRLLPCFDVAPTDPYLITHIN